MSINRKLTILLISLFLFASLILIFFSFSFLRTIEEKQVQKVYKERLRIMMIFIENRYNALLDTGMAEIYEDVYKKDLIRDLRQIYYLDKGQTYPFILDPDRKRLMHPIFSPDHSAMNDKEKFIVDKILTDKNGTFEYRWGAVQKWCVFREFEPWNWYIAFTVDDSVRYDIFYQYVLRYSGVIIVVCGLIAIAIMLILKNSILNPILLLKEKCKNVLDTDNSSGLFELSDKKDEIGELATEFVEMETRLKNSRQKQLEIARQKEVSIQELKAALTQVKHLKGMLPICANCKKIRDDSGYWQQVEQYVEAYSNVKFSHGICPECSDKLYGKEKWYIKAKKKTLENKS